MKKIEDEMRLKELYKLSDIDLLRFFKREPSSIAFYPLSKRLFTKKRYKESIQILKNGIQNYPDFIEPKVLLAKTYIKIESYVEAVQFLREMIKFAPDYAESYFYLSEILFKKEIIERAEILLTKAYELSPHTPHIKNSFEKRFKNVGNTTTASFNIESTVIESIDDIKKRAVKELYQESGQEVPEDLDNHQIEKEAFEKRSDSDENILDELEKEFSYKKKQTSINIIGTLVVLAIIAYILFLISSKDKQIQVNKKKDNMLIALNTNLENINKEIPNNFPDITLYYKLLYHYQVDTKKYAEAITKVKKIKSSKNKWQHLSLMAYFLFNNKDKEFNNLYDKLKIKYKENPDIFLLKGYQLLGTNDKLNSQLLFNSAYQKSNNTNRFKSELASLYLNRGALDKLKSLKTVKSP